MKLKIPNAKELSDARKRQLFYMALGMAFIFIGVPLATYFLTNWNSLINDDNYTHLSKPDFAIDDNIENEGIFTIDWTGIYSAVPVWQEAILWDNITGDHTLIITDTEASDRAELYFVTHYRLSDIIDSSMGTWKISINGTGAEGRISMFSYDPGSSWDAIDFLNLSAYYTGEKAQLHAHNFDNATAYNVTFSTLDLMEHKINNGDGYLIFCVKSQNFQMITDWAGDPGAEVYACPDFFSPGDTIGFSFEYYDYSDGLISENTVLQWGGASIGVVCLVLAMMSTTYWNPSQPNNPGFVDRWIGRGTKWVSGKKKKGRKK